VVFLSPSGQIPGCKISGFHGGDYEKFRLVGFYFWRGSCKNRRLGGTYRLHHQGDKNGRGRNNVSRNWQPTSPTKANYVVVVLVRRLLSP
jgi:hypothetical protein